MKILFIVPYVPTPIRVRPYSLIKALLERGHQVALATLWRDEQEREQLAQWEKMGVKVIAETLPRLRSVRNCLAALPTATPLQAVYCWQPQLKQRLDDLLRTERFDAIHVEHLRGVHYGLALKDKGVPLIWDSVDCISYLFEQASEKSRSTFGKMMTGLELGRTRRYEGWLVNQFDKVLVTSKIDKEALHQLSSQYLAKNSKDTVADNIRVLPNGVDQTYFTPNGKKASEDTLVFSGKMSYHANVTMALHLINDIMPYVWSERQEVKVNIVGKDPPPSVQNLAKDRRVNVTGFVPEILPYLQQATVAVAPAVYGAGIQNKVLEAMACGTAVVSTDRAIAALNLKPDRDIMVASDPETFAKKVLTLLNNPALCQEIGANGLRYVQQEHSWSTAAAKLEQIIEELSRLNVN